MNRPTVLPAAAPTLAPRYLYLLPLLFVGSGCAALIYEIVWFQLVELVIGSSAVSLGVLLGTFMGGMCLGSLLLPRWSPESAPTAASTRCSKPESACSACWCSFGLPPLGNLYASSVGRRIDRHPAARRVLRDLPAGSHHDDGRDAACHRALGKATPTGVSWLGFFYGSNIVGAVVGCLLAGFYLLRVYDMATATLRRFRDQRRWSPAQRSSWRAGRRISRKRQSRVRCSWPDWRSQRVRRHRVVGADRDRR